MRHHSAIFALLLAISPAYVLADDFSDTLKEVMDNHPAIKAEEEALAALHTTVPEAYAGFLPTATAGYDRGRQKVRYNALQPQYENVTGKDLTVTQPIFNGGDTIARIGASKARYKAGQARFSLEKQDILLRAIGAYVGVAEKQRALLIASENVKTLTAHLQATKTQFSFGELTVTDVSQSETRLARARAELRDAEASLAMANAAYARDIGRTPDEKTLPPLPETLLPKTGEEADARASNNPAVQQAEQNEKAARYTVGSRYAAFLPDVNVQGRIDNREGSSTPATYSSDSRALMLQVSVPIFQGGAEYTRLSEAKHQRARARFEIIDTGKAVREEAMRQWQDFSAAGDVVEAYRESLAAAEKALKSVRVERKEGTRTVLDVLNAQEEVFAAQVNLLRAKSRHVLSAYRLLAATGMLEQAIAPSVSTADTTPRTETLPSTSPSPLAEPVSLELGAPGKNVRSLSESDCTKTQDEAIIKAAPFLVGMEEFDEHTIACNQAGWIM
jgi:outer membrane protein